MRANSSPKARTWKSRMILCSRRRGASATPQQAAAPQRQQAAAFHGACGSLTGMKSRYRPVDLLHHLWTAVAFIIDDNELTLRPVAVEFPCGLKGRTDIPSSVNQD